MTKVHQIYVKSSQIMEDETFKSEWRYSKPFWNVKVTNENELADFTYFNPKLVVMATSLERSDKGRSAW